MRKIRIILAAGVFGALAFGATTPAQAAKPCNQYPTFMQPIICQILEKLT